MESNISIKVESLDEAWEYWYELLSKQNISFSSRDGEVVGEVLNSITTITDPINNIMKSTIRKFPMKYALGELLWYLSGNNNLKEIQKYSSGWDRMSDDGITVNSNYGYCIFKKFGFNQLEYIYNLLKKYPDTRQAIIHIKGPDNVDSKDVNCTVAIQFFIRENKLYATTYMRSNDIWLGFPFDVFQFTCLQIYLSMKLGVDIGSYTHVVGSLHLYKRNLK